MKRSSVVSVLVTTGLLLMGCTATAEKEVASSSAKPQVKTDKADTSVAQKKAAMPAASKRMTQEELLASVRGGSYLDYPEAKVFIEEMKAEGFDEAYLRKVLGEAKRQTSILKAISRPAERRLTWGGYRKIFIEPKRIKQGVKFWQDNQESLAKAEQKYGVPAEIIVSIIGVETRYGRIMGSYRVLDALATLGFDYPRRSKFFLGQLKEYLHLVKEEKVDFTSLKGSYAGAMGFGQFIPSSYRNFAIDFDQDGKRDIWSNKTDAIGSVANYFAEHKWKPGQPVISGVSFTKAADEAWYSVGRKGLIPQNTLAEWVDRGVEPQLNLSPEEKAILMQMEIGDDKQYWLGLHNFYVITRYNHSKLYAMAVYRLSQQIKDAYEKATVKSVAMQTKSN
ncbi:lytic murein transglycosylase B [Neptuniibacter caesariensis]|uniref:Membrane-bound lytic transglycosylase n=1 Tax=Neptuniibacter caesariensis TaxID=207954 RepID=A0A7U8C7G6_NEPCE|nr:lytic murein transglycosylase B [Neptuniibacter caesariensis]EAR62985.1 membrane-bound lytic transglycosylase [Oceanospirillum sp. MED92] [Neptuniibacter caesariensis]